MLRAIKIMGMFSLIRVYGHCTNIEIETSRSFILTIQVWLSTHFDIKKNIYILNLLHKIHYLMIGIIVQNLKCKFAIIQTPNNRTVILKMLRNVSKFINKDSVKCQSYSWDFTLSLILIAAFSRAAFVNSFHSTIQNVTVPTVPNTARISNWCGNWRAVE